MGEGAGMNDYDVMQIHHAGLIIVESYAMVDHHVEQFRFPRSKKRRIIKREEERQLMKWR